MKNLLALLIALFFFTACKKERILYISDDIKRNFSYKPGSYWIYRDSVSGREDSCYVVDKNISMVDIYDRSTSQNYDKYESLHINLRVASLGHSYKFENTIYIKNDNFIYMFGSNYTYSFRVFGCPLPISTSSINKYRYGNTIEFLPSININGKEFINNFKMNNDDGLCYFNNNVGVIKLSTVLDSTSYNYELIRYRVIK